MNKVNKDNIYLFQKKQKSANHSDTTMSEDFILSVLKEHEADLKRFLKFRLAGHPDREDLMQEVLLRLMEKKESQQSLSHGHKKTKAYLIVIASNLIHDMNRRRKVREVKNKEILHYEIESSIADKRTPEKQAAIRQKLIKANKVLESLSPKCHQVFKLSRFHNLSYREIGEQLNISVSMVKKYITQALVALRKKIDFDEKE